MYKYYAREGIYAYVWLGDQMCVLVSFVQLKIFYLDTEQRQKLSVFGALYWGCKMFLVFSYKNQINFRQL